VTFETSHNILRQLILGGFELQASEWLSEGEHRRARERARKRESKIARGRDKERDGGGQGVRGWERKCV